LDLDLETQKFLKSLVENTEQLTLDERNRAITTLTDPVNRIELITAKKMSGIPQTTITTQLSDADLKMLIIHFMEQLVASEYVKEFQIRG
jgi:hypothetical protein